MVKTLSSMLDLGTIAPNFSLIDTTSGKLFSLDNNQGNNATVIMFICNHCPYVKHIAHELTNIANNYIPKGISFIAINSNDITQYPDDSPENMQATAKNLAYPFPYLFDETQEVAHAYHAKCTPDFFVFDKNLHLVYRGQLDDSRPGSNTPVTGDSMRQALDSLLTNQPITVIQKPSIGCNIKWK
jgi:peroxiredoxin